MRLFVLYLLHNYSTYTWVSWTCTFSYDPWHGQCHPSRPMFTSNVAPNVLYRMKNIAYSVVCFVYDFFHDYDCSGDSANAVPHTEKLRTRVTHIWGNRSRQPNRSAMEGPLTGGTALLITVSPVPGKYASVTFLSLSIRRRICLDVVYIWCICSDDSFVIIQNQCKTFISTCFRI